jgi:hypothetical protein
MCSRFLVLASEIYVQCDHSMMPLTAHWDYVQYSQYYIMTPIILYFFTLFTFLLLLMMPAFRRRDD